MPNQRHRIRDVLLAAAARTAAVVVIAVFLLVVADIVSHGGDGVSFSFLTESPQRAGRLGGIGPVIVSTLLIVAVCLVVAVPLGLGCATFLALFAQPRGAIASVVRVCLDVLASTPSIVFGLFGSAFFCLYLGLGFSTLSGGLTLACMILPGIIRMTEEGLRSVPQEYQLNGAALGLSKTSVLFNVLLPTAAPALVAAVILGLGRALSETAALLFTSGYVLRMPESLLDSGRSLSVHIYDLALNVPGGDTNAYRSAMVLLVVLLLLNSCALWMMKHWMKRVTTR